MNNLGFISLTGDILVLIINPGPFLGPEKAGRRLPPSARSFFRLSRCVTGLFPSGRSRRQRRAVRLVHRPPQDAPRGDRAEAPAVAALQGIVAPKEVTAVVGDADYSFDHPHKIGRAHV